MRGVLVALDLETTGLDPSTAQIIEIGAVKFQDNQVLETYSTLVDPESQIPAKVTAITGITQDKLVGAPKLREVLPQITQFVGTAPLVGHNIEFDLRFLHKAGVFQDNPSVDTYELASVLLPTTPRYNLNALMQELNLLPEGDYHRALADALATARVYMALWDKLINRLPLDVLRDIVEAAQALPWRGSAVFADSLSARLQNNPGEQIARKPVFVPAPDTQSARREPQPAATLSPLDADALAAMIEPGGAVASALDGFEARVQQVEMLRAVCDAFNHDDKLIIEATAGTGRSLAYLLPAVAWATQNRDRVVLSAGSASLQSQVLDRELPLLKQALDLDFSAVLLKRRSSYLCPRRLEVLRRRKPTSVDELRVFAKVLVWLSESDPKTLMESTPTQGRSDHPAGLSLRGPAEYSVWTRLSAQGEECTLDRCREQMQGVCPFYKACQAAQNAEIVVANHELLISDAPLPPESQILPTYQRVIVDEAHNLEENITRSLEFRLDPISVRRQLADLGSAKNGLLGEILDSTKAALPVNYYGQIERFVANITDTLPKMHQHIDTLFNDLRSFLEATNNLRGSDYLIQVRLTTTLRNKPAFSQVKAAWGILSQFIEAMSDAMTKLNSSFATLRERYGIPFIEDLMYGTRAASQHLATLFKQLHEIIVEPDGNTIYWIEISPDQEVMSIHGAPLSVGPLVKKALWDAKQTVVMASATLRASGSFEYVRQRLNADNVNEVALASPYNYEQSTLIYLPTDMPEPQERNRYQQFVERGIIELAAATEGRLLVLFTGYTQLREVAQKIAPRLALGNITVFDQSDGTSREALLNGFRNTQRAVLLGTRSLWEDVDLSGSDLVALVIVRLPFAVPSDPVYAARGEGYENSFNQYTVPDAILRFRQGFDRLVRARNARGVVAVFDKRMISKEYGQSFLESLPACTVLRAPMEEIGARAKEWLGEELASGR